MLIIRTDILEYLQNEIYSRCKKPTNKFGMGCYWHIEAVVKNAEILAERYNADKEVVMIAAWLHDIASITDYTLYENHHIHGAEMAREILSKLSYDESKILIVQNCIRNHRGSVFVDKNSVEELCVADANTYKMATRIAERENANVELVQLAALLHDVDDIKLSPKTHKNKDNVHTANTGRKMCAREIAEGRERYMKDYISEFMDEWDGIR